MHPAENIIQKKRDSHALKACEIQAFIAGVTSGSISDAQIAAFTMATWFNGMSVDETRALTLAMRDSGEVLHWPELDGPVLDKHSTGGVGDMVSLVLGPLIAACGAFVPMISGRGLGHTGGTLDKLESIPGFCTSPASQTFRRLVQECGIAIIGQTDQLAPADRRIYAVRDVTATVSSPPLMISSILSKKLAEGLDGLVLDIKYGSGAFTASPSEAVELAERISTVAVSAGLPCHAVVTSMDVPLAWSAGNALEIHEVIRLLRGDKKHGRLEAVVLELAAELLFLGGLAESSGAGRALAKAVLESGRAAERFSAMVAGQGGPADLLEKPESFLPRASLARAVYPPVAGYVSAVDTLALGSAVVQLGGGRRRVDDEIDPSVGLDHIAAVGDAVGPGEPLAFIHAQDEGAWEFAASALLSAFTIGDAQLTAPPLIHGTIRGA